MSWYVILASFVGTVAFSVLYNIPPRYWLSCGLTGVAGWIVFSLLRPFTGYGFAIFLSSAVVTFIARLLAVKMKTPEIIFLIAGIFTLVPGADIYWTVYYLVAEEMEKALSSGSAAAEACLGMVLGIVIVHELPQKLFVRLSGRQNGER